MEVARPTAGSPDNASDTGCTESFNRGENGEEHIAARGSWSIREIVGERLPDVRWQRQAFATALGVDGDLATSPVDVIQLEVGQLQRAQAQTRQQDDDCEV